MVFTSGRNRKRAYAQATTGIVLVLVLVAMAVSAPWLATHDPYRVDTENWLRPPSGEHYLGTDRLGRDIFSRVLFGARVSLSVGVLAMLLVVGLGTSFGMIAGYYGGIIDLLIMRFTDIVLVFPTLFLVLSLVAIFEPQLWLVIVVIGITGWPATARLVRGEFLRLRETEYVASARLVGASDTRVIFRHILPNVLDLILVSATLAVPHAIMTEAGLSYFGLGIQSSIPTWGNMLRDSQLYLRHAWWYAAFPGFFIFLTVLSFHILAEGLRGYFDPQNRRRRRHHA